MYDRKLHADLLAEVAQLNKMIADTPADDVIDRSSLEWRLKRVKDELATLEPPRVTVGRIVDFCWTPDYTPGRNTSVIWAAIVTAVHDDGAVSLTLFPPNETPRPANGRVPFSPEPEDNFWTWPQKV